ncbi:MAG: hypothetical protein M1836_004045 [Candelina mexicana]|nr:MAG: hypothetical protein M1836_004045 [Candelina mexicana]
MAPSPAAGKADAPDTPKTPTKPGKNPKSNTTSKLGQSTSASDSPAKSAQKTSTPKTAPKPSASKAKDTPSKARDTPSKAKDTPTKAAKTAGDKAGTDSPSLPPRPKEADNATKGADDATKEAGNATKGADDATKQAGDTAKKETEKAPEADTTDVDPEDEADDAADKVEMKDNDPEDTPQGKVSQTGNETGAEESSAVSTADDLEEAAPEPVDDDEEGEDAAEGAKDTATGAVGGATDKAQGAAESAKDKAEDATDDAADTAKDTAGDAKDKIEDEADGDATETGEDATGDVEDAAGDATEGADVDGVKDTADDAASGVTEEVDADGAEDAVEDAADDVEDAAEDLEDDAEEAGDEAAGGLAALKGLKVGEDGQILGPDGEPIAQLTEGEAGELAGKTVNENGEILDEDGDVIGRVEPLDKAEEAADLPDVDAMEGLKANEDGEILNDDGEVIGKVVEGDAEDLAGQTLNEKGEFVDEDGEVIGRAEVVPGEAAEKAQDAAEGIADFNELSILEGKKLTKKGTIIDEEGDPMAKLVEGDPKECAGKFVNEKGEVLNDDGEVIGKMELIRSDTVEELVDQAKEDAKEAAKPDLSFLNGKKLTKKGTILDEEGDPVAKLAEGDPKECAGKFANENGEVVDADGKVIGKLEIVPGEASEAMIAEAQKAKDAAAAEEAPEEGEEAAEEGAEEGEEGAPELPPLSILEGLKCNKQGKIVDADGTPVGELIEGDPKKLSKLGAECDEEGQFWDGKGKVIGRAQTLPVTEKGEEAPFSGLEGLIVVEGGNIQDENENIVGKLVEGDPKKLVGRAVDEDGDVLDKNGNTIGHAERLPEEEIPEEEPVDLSILAGKVVNKQGNVIGDEGVPIGRLVEGDPKKLQGMKCDENGQIWNDTGKVIGRCELIPEEERETRAEGIFGGLEGVVVAQDGIVIDADQNRVGTVVEGDPKKLVGRAVDEDGDIVDKYGNTVGRAERWEEPPLEEQDLSIVNGKPVNKQGNVIGDEGVPIARLVEGDAKKLAGKKCDMKGQLWSDNGQVIGRVELIPENEREDKPEGPFAGLEGLVVVKGGKVEDEGGNVVGEVVEGDPKKLVGRAVDDDGDIIDKYGNVKGHAEPIEEEELEEIDLSELDGTTVNKAGNLVDANGNVIGRVVEGDPKHLVGKMCDGEGQIWGGNGKVAGRAELIPLGERDSKKEGAFSGWENLVIAKCPKDIAKNNPDDAPEAVVMAGEDVIGRVVQGDPKMLIGRTVDEEGEVLDKNGNSIGKAERWEPKEKERHVNPMSGHKVNSDGEVRDENGNILGYVTEGDYHNFVGFEVNDDGFVVDNEDRVVGACTLKENMQEPEEEGPTEEELKRQEDAKLADAMANQVQKCLDQLQPVCKQITEHIEVADRTPKEELDEEELVNKVKPLIEEGGRILQECNGAIRGLDPDGRIAAQAKGRAAQREASPEEYRLADLLKELTQTVTTTIDNAKKRIADMPHAKKELNPLWGLLTEPLFQIIAAVGLLLSGVLGLVGKLLNGLGLGGIVNGLLGGLGIDKLLGGLGLGSITKSLGLGGGKKK